MSVTHAGGGTIYALFIETCSAFTTAAGAAPKPTRSMMRVLGELEGAMGGGGGLPPLLGTCPTALLPTVTPAVAPSAIEGRDGIDEPPSLPRLYQMLHTLDFSNHYLGTQASSALIRTLRSLPSTLLPAAGPNCTNYCRLTALVLPQCGLDTSSAVELYRLMTSAAFAFTLKELDVRNNPYLALEAGQLFLAGLGFVITDDSHSFQERSIDESNERHMRNVPGVREYVSRLCRLVTEGTNIPPHYVRRIDRLHYVRKSWYTKMLELVDFFEKNL